MARGWESKGVEQQQEEASRGSSKSPPLTPEQARVQQQRQGILLSRTRVLEQMEKARDPRHRQMLEQALAALDQQLAGLPIR